MSQSSLGSWLEHTLCTSGCSRLQQKQLHLNQALTNEERRVERLNGLVHKFERQLLSETSNDRMKTLRRQLRNLNLRRAQSERTMLSLLQNLNFIMAQMEGLHSPTWLKPYSEYALRTPSSDMTTSGPAFPHWHINSPPLLVGTPHFWTLPTATTLQSPIISNLVSPYEQQYTDDQLPVTPIIRAMPSIPNPDFVWQEYSYPHYVSNHQRIDTDMVSPTDTVSTYSLSPLPPTSTETFPTDLIPGTQVFDLVNGMGAIGLDQGRENLLSADYSFPSQEPQPQPMESRYTATRQLNLLGGQSAAIRLERVARAIDLGSRRSI